MKSVFRLFATMLLAAVLLSATRPVQAETWQNGGDSLWANSLNWDTGVPTSGSSAIFDIAGSTTVDLGGASRDLLNLIFNAGAQGYTFTGNAGDKLNFASGGSIAANSGITAAETINSAIGLNGGPFTITNDDTSNLLTLGGGISLTSGTADVLTVAGASNTTINGAIAAGAITDLIKSGTGRLTLGAVNAYTGTTTVNANGGILQFANKTALYNNNTGSWTAANMIVNSGAAMAFNVGGGGEFALTDIDNFRALTSFTAGSSIGIDTTNNGGTLTYATNLADTTGANGIVKLGTNTLELTGNNTYTGLTVIAGGALTKGTATAIPSGTPLVFGNLSTSGNLDLGTFDQTASSLTAQSNTATANKITIGAGKTLTVTGSAVANVVSIGGRESADPITRLNVVGSTGTLTVDDSTRNIVVSQLAASGGIVGAQAILDLSGLGTFNATVANVFVARPTTVAGAAAVNPQGAQPLDTLILANNNTITVGTVIAVAGTTFTGGSGTIRLGTTNTINSAAWVVGLARVQGIVNFNDGLVNPTVTLNGAAGAGSRTNITLGDQRNQNLLATNSGGSTQITGTMDFTGGTVIALIDILVVGNGAASGSGVRGRGDGVFTFGGSGSNVDVNTLVISRDFASTGSGNGVGSNSAVNVNGGTFVVNTSFIIASDIDNSSNGGRQDLTGAFNLNGGTATVGSVGTPVDITLGNLPNGVGGALAPKGIMTANLNVNGGALTVNGNISRGILNGPTGGTIISSVTLNGGTLDMTGHNIGPSGAEITNLNFQAGTLSNVAEINGGSSGLTKTTAGTLTLGGANTYTGATSVQGGTLLVNGTHTGGGAYTVNDFGDYNLNGVVDGADYVLWRKNPGGYGGDPDGYNTWRQNFGNHGGTLGGTGSITADVVVNPGGILAPGASVGTLTVGSADIDGKLLVEYSGTASTIDKLIVTGALDITNTTLDFDNLGGTLSGGPYVFATYGAGLLTGTFTSPLDLPAGYNIVYNYLSGNQIALVSAGSGSSLGSSAGIGSSAVPEPATLMLVVFGALGALLVRKR